MTFRNIFHIFRAYLFFCFLQINLAVVDGNHRMSAFSCDAPHYSSSSARAMHRDGPGPSLVKSYIMLVMPQHSLSFRQDLWSFMVLMFLISLLRPTSMALRQEVLFQCKLRINRTSRILQLSNERDIYSSPSQSKDNCRLAELDVPLALFPPR